MGWMRRAFAWILILGGGFILMALALNLVIERPEGSKPPDFKALLAAGFMLGQNGPNLSCQPLFLRQYQHHLR
jgi:hypothetical protein